MLRCGWGFVKILLWISEWPQTADLVGSSWSESCGGPSPCLVMPASSPPLWGHRQRRAPWWCCGLWSDCSAPRGSGRGGRNLWSSVWNSHPKMRTAQGWGYCWCSPRRYTGASWLLPGGSWCRSPPRSSQWWRCGWGSSRWWRQLPPPAPCGWSDACCGLSPWSLTAGGRSSGAGSWDRSIWWWPRQEPQRQRWRRRS